MTPFFRKLLWLTRRRRKETELQEELQFHLDEEAEEREAEGVAKEQAQWAARRDLGNVTLVQENTRYCAKDCNLAQPGDLLFYDQGDAQHLMVWMGNFIAYHTGGEPTRDDSGLRAVALRDLLAWSDTRWQPSEANPNFAGVYRLAFLTA